jgi:5-methylcytosine-specific restriction endonuclease McrA
MTNGKRDYKKEYAHYAGKPSEIHKRVIRNHARALFEKAGLVHKGDGKDVDHVHPLDKGGSNDRTNLRVRSAHANRSFKRTSSNDMA